MKLSHVLEAATVIGDYNGSIAFTGTAFQSVAQYDCDQGYMLDGEGARTYQTSRA